jgi:hypothetical protein
MSQGKEFTKKEREIIIQGLKPFLEIGYSRNKACELTGLAPGTLSNWVKDNEVLGMKLKGWESTVDTMVMANLVDAIRIEGETNDARKETSKWWAERKMKHDFSLKLEQEITGDGLKTIIINKGNYSDSEQHSDN